MPNSPRRRPSLEALEPRLALSGTGPCPALPASISGVVSTCVGPAPINPTFDPISLPPVNAPSIAPYDLVYVDIMSFDDCSSLIVDDPFSPVALD